MKKLTLAIALALIVSLLCTSALAETHLNVAWWGNQTRNDRTQAVLDLYTAENGTTFDVTMNNFGDYWTTMATASAGGQLPDVLQHSTTYIQQYVDNGLLLNLDPYIESGALDVSNIGESILNLGRINDGIYGICVGTNGLACLYNKTVLDEGINAIAQETASMKELVESLLFLARHDKKTLMMEMSSFDVLDVVSELHKEAVMVTPEDTFVLSPSDHCVVEADRGMIKQVMRILCDNAVKYTPKGGTITIGVQRKPGGCTLSLSDTGPGIAPEELPKIFERFYRSDSARKAESSGHGLGLSIARIIVVAHGGKLRVRSKVGAGTTFSIDLPGKQENLHTATLSKRA